MKCLVDTDWIIDHLKGIEKVREKLKEFRQYCGIAVSIFSLAELYEGIYSSRDPIKDQRLLENLLTQFSVLGIDREICKVFGRERTNLRKKKQLIGDMDLLIASTALHHNLTILTNNLKHFERVEGLKIFSIKE